MMSCAQFFAFVMGATCLKAKDLSVPHGSGIAMAMLHFSLCQKVAMQHVAVLGYQPHLSPGSQGEGVRLEKLLRDNGEGLVGVKQQESFISLPAFLVNRVGRERSCLCTGCNSKVRHRS